MLFLGGLPGMPGLPACLLLAWYVQTWPIIAYNCNYYNKHIAYIIQNNLSIYTTYDMINVWKVEQNQNNIIKNNMNSDNNLVRQRWPKL